ncbi:MAG: hypothetical protein ACKVQC_11020 [Elusimicrobiota bacterium]
MKVVLFGDNGVVMGVPAAPFEKALDGDRSILFPDFSGQTVKAAIIFLDSHNNRPASIRRIESMIVKFNNSGQIDFSEDKEESDLMGKVLGGFASKSSSDILESLKPDLAALQYRDKFKWTPDLRHLKTIRELALS